MKALIFGGSGQVGTELKKLVQLNGDVRVVERREADFSRPQTIEKLVDEVKPTRIINAAAYTSVDQAEVEEDLVHQVNATAVNALAACAKKYDALLGITLRITSSMARQKDLIKRWMRQIPRQCTDNQN